MRTRDWSRCDISFLDVRMAAVLGWGREETHVGAAFVGFDVLKSGVD